MTRRYSYNPVTMTYEPVDDPKSLKIFRAVVFVVAGIALVCFYLWLYIFVFKIDSPKSFLIRHQHEKWEARAALLKHNLTVSDRALTAVEQRNNGVYRSIYGLPPVTFVYDYATLSELPKYENLTHMGAGPELRRLVMHSDVLNRRVYLQGDALEEVSSAALQAGDMISCVPNIPPICPEVGTYRVSSLFGNRRDPFFRGRAFHRGVDFATHRGNPVYVTGDGVVEQVRYQFSGYGNEVVVNHGFGYKSHYAHLKSIDVNEGMYVMRGRKIGTVGNSGRSTGPHLHYEVLYRGNAVDPLNYMDLNMPVSEYKDMTRTRQSEQVEHRNKTLSEILNRNK